MGKTSIADGGIFNGIRIRRGNAWSDTAFLQVQGTASGTLQVRMSDNRATTSGGWTLVAGTTTGDQGFATVASISTNTTPGIAATGDGSIDGHLYLPSAKNIYLGGQRVVYRDGTWIYLGGISGGASGVKIRANSADAITINSSRQIAIPITLSIGTSTPQGNNSLEVTGNIYISGKIISNRCGRRDVNGGSSSITVSISNLDTTKSVIVVTPTWDTTTRITDITTSSFTITFGTNAPGASEITNYIHWIVMDTP